MKPRDIALLQTTLGHHFQRVELLEQALTHSSQARELEALQAAGGPRVGDNEQMEFLGDAVLGFVTTEELCNRFPSFREGELSKLRAHLVSEKHLIHVAQELELGHYLNLGRGEEKSGGRTKTALLVDALEAVVAAIYLDGGLDAARDLILRSIVVPEVTRIASQGSSLPVTDYKSALQEKLQSTGRPQPTYTLVKERGPEHSKTFTVEARLQPLDNGGKAEFIGKAEGTTKKNAEQDAARQVLEYLGTVAAGPNGTNSKKRSEHA